MVKQSTTVKLLPLAAMEKIMKAAGGPRVSEEAKVALRDVLEEIGGQIADKATKLAIHSGRKTVKSEDIKLAAKG